MEAAYIKALRNNNPRTRANAKQAVKQALSRHIEMGIMEGKEGGNLINYIAEFSHRWKPDTLGSSPLEMAL